MIRIALDAMGGDYAPSAIVKGAVMAAELYDCQIILVGDKEKIEAELKRYPRAKRDKILIEHASEVVEMHEHAALAIRKKKDSSISVGIDLVADKKADAFISAGNTGALVAGSTLIVGRLKGVLRPALAPMIPTLKGFSLLIDGGANVDAKPAFLKQFAQMGTIYLKNVVGVEEPKVGLINIGTEEKKGNVLNESGKVVGYHTGVTFLTIGQRHGFTIADKGTHDEPYYIVSKDIKNNAITVSHTVRDDGRKIRPISNGTNHKSIKIKDANWVSGKMPDTNR